MNKKLTRSDRQSQLDNVRKNAMPEVKRLVKKYDRTVISWCVNQLRDYEKKVKELELKRKEVAQLEKEI